MNLKYQIEEIEKVAELFLCEIINKKANIVCLTGDLGAGKTTLMQNVGKLLGVENKMPSPTFVLRRDYKIENNYFNNLIHIDAYRLDKPEMINQVLTKTEIENKENLIVIEWGERLNKDIFDMVFEIKHMGENEREIILL
jgi:tRNA threonylcarbamoyladenosine biosynthesis protein TsaE